MRVPRIISNSAIYSVVSVLQKSILFILLPLYTAYLSPESYGTISVINSIGSFLSIFILFSLNSAATRFYFINNDENYSKRLWGTLTIVVIINSVIIGLLIIFLHHWLIDPITKGIDFYPFVLLGILNIIVSPLYLFFQSYLRAIQDGKQYGINALSYFILQVSLTVIFLTIFHLSVIGVLLANLITAIVFFIYSLVFFQKKISWMIDKKITKSAIKYAAPLLPHHLFSWSSGMLNTLMINNYNGTGNSGLYSATTQIGGVVNMIAIAVNSAYTPWFFKKIKNTSNSEQIRQVTYLSVWLFSVLALAISLFSKEILILMVSDEYIGIWIYVPFISFAYVLQSVYYFFVNYLYLSQTRKVFYCTMVGALVNIVVNIVLLPKIGIAGAIIALVLTIITRMIVAIWLARRESSYISINFFMLGLPILFFFIISLIVFYVDNMTIWVRLAVKFICFVIPIMLFLLIKRKQLISIFHFFKN